MANIRELRAEGRLPSAPVVDGVVVEGAEGACGDFEGEDGFDDEDLWDCLDLMETSVKVIRRTMDHCRMSPRRKRLLENHCLDLELHIEKFLVA